MIKVEGLTKDYGSRRAIHDLSFHAKKGEILGFLGPNGAGKTTTMRILSGYMPPTFGVATIGGLDVVDSSFEVRKLVGYMPETVPLYLDMTVYDYLEFMAELHRVKNIPDRVEEVIGLIHLEERAFSFIKNLSKGMRQRVGLAQAILHKPEVLILDEPTIGLDPAQIIEVRNLIRDIGKKHTVLLSTHILTEAQQLCDRVIIMNKGHIVAEDSPTHLQARLSGAQRVMVTILGESAELLPLVSSIPGISHVQLHSEDSFEFESSPGLDLRPEVARKIIQSGFDLLDFHPATMSLEEIFLELIHDEPARLELRDYQTVDGMGEGD
ncbi:MAG: ABC transporter ATP-binding protein [Anaerolineaceae bacterium]